MKFIQHPPSESRGAQGIPAIPTLTIVSSEGGTTPAAPAVPVAPAPLPSPVSVPAAVAPATVVPAVPPAPTLSWQQTMDSQTRALEMDLKKGHIVNTQNLKQQLQGILQSQQSLKDLQKVQFEKTVEKVKQEWQEEFKTLEKNFQSQKSQWSGELEAKQNVIETLQKEIAKAREQLDALVAAKQEVVPASVPERPVSAPVMEPEVSPETDAIASVQESSVLPPIDSHVAESPRVAILQKLWDYLSQPAIEIPLRKHRHREWRE